ncbi:MAG: ECF transporter S component [Ruminococcus sp.]|nr:ECF transporter S component [Ruminococcus sp.]
MKTKEKSKKIFNLRQLTILGLMSALVFIFSYTPIGSIPIGPLVITLNIIPIAIAAVACGVPGGAIIGGLFGLMSFFQCLGFGVPSAMGAILFDINPVLAFIQRFVPRVLDGIIAGYAFKITKGISRNNTVSCAVTGFCSAFFNTLLFMTALILCFGYTDYLKGLIDGRNIFVFVVTFVGVNALVEMAASTLVTAAVGTALFKARLIPEKK